MPAKSDEENQTKSDEISKYWDELENGGEIKNLLGSDAVVKNTNRMRFQVKTISLKEDEPQF